MDTKDIAALIGTTPRTLRQFLRSPMSTFVAVGSGARYDFTEKDVPTLKRRFTEWQGAGKPQPQTPKTKAKAASGKSSAKTKTQLDRDQEVWSEEGPVVIEDIRDPRVRARIRAAARAAEDQLMMLLLAKKMHVTQLGDRESA